MEINKTKNGIYVVSNPIVDLGKEIDDNFTQNKRNKWFGLKKEKGIYVPNRLAERPKQSKLVKAAAGLVLAGASMLGCNSTPRIPHELQKAYGTNAPVIDNTQSQNTSVVNPTKDNNTTQKEYNGHGPSLSLYALQRDQIKGQDSPKWERGTGLELEFPLNKNFTLYFNGEYDNKERTVNNESGSVFLDSDVYTFGAGAKFNFINTNKFRMGLAAGLWRRNEINNINGVVGIAPIHEEDRVAYTGAEAKIDATIYLGKNWGLTGSVGYNNPISRPTDFNTEDFYKFTLGLNLDF